MCRSDFIIEVAAANGRPQRLVSIQRTDGISFRDHIDTNSSVSRQRLTAKVARKFSLEHDQLGWLDDEIVEAADRADEGADEAVGEENQRKSTTDLLVELALTRYRLGRTEADEPFAVTHDGPNVALMFRGSRDALRSALSREFRLLHGRTPNSAALTDTLTTLQGEAFTVEPEPVHLRAAEQNEGIVIDLGDSTGRSVVVTSGGWQVTERSPVLFRRTAATGQLPVPQRGGHLDELRELVNVTAETWPLVVGWLLSALMPKLPHPILLIGGQQGSGKSTAAQMLAGLIDPSPAQLRSQPRDPETWAISASASWVVAIDNISTISEWWSDSLCKAVTGDGWLRRKLYTDGDLAVLSFRRVVLLTSIDAGALRGDLGDRVLLVELEPIGEESRRTERHINAQYQNARPRLFGALLTLLSRVMAELPNVADLRLPRMADFGQLLAAFDRAADDADNGALRLYMDQRGRVAETVIESDPVAMAIESLVEVEGLWEGTAGDLLARISPEKPPKGWPQTPQGLGGRLKRLIPALEQAGIAVTHGREGHQRTRRYHMTRKIDELNNQTSASSAVVEAPVDSSDTVRTTADNCGQSFGAECPPPAPVNAAENPQADNADDPFHQPSATQPATQPTEFRSLCSGHSA